MVAYEGLIEILHHDFFFNFRFEEDVYVGNLGKEELRDICNCYFCLVLSLLDSNTICAGQPKKGWTPPEGTRSKVAK